MRLAIPRSTRRDSDSSIGRSAWLVISIAAMMCVACSQHAETSSTGPNQTPIPIWQLSPLEHQRKVTEDALARLEQTAAPFDLADFGPGTRSLAYRSPDHIEDAYSAPDGTLYVVTSKTLGVSQYDLESLATLNNGRIRQISMPPVGKYHQGYSGIDFVVGQDLYRPIVRANDFEGHDYYLAVSPNGVRRTSAPLSQDYYTYRLSTGEICMPESSTRSSVAVWALDRAAHRRPFVTKAALYGASRNLVDDQSLRFNTVRCFHLGHLDLLNVGDRIEGLVYIVTDGKPRLVTRGEILTSGDHHIILLREETDIGGGFNGEREGHEELPDLTDYLEVFTRE